jgi:hypothetical protein
MWFFSKFRTFSRLSVEFEERIAQLESRNASLRRDLAELDEFTHRIARKRYQETYVPAEATPGQSEHGIVAPGGGVAEIERVSSAKRAIWAKVKGLKAG